MSSEEVLSDAIDFSYSGHLIFNGLYTTDPSGLDVSNDEIELLRNRISELLPPLTAEHDGGPKKGFQRINLESYFDQYSFERKNASLTPKHRELAEVLLDREYVREEYTGEVRVQTDDGRVSGEEITRHSAYLYWLLPSLLLVQGARPDRKRAMSTVNEVVGIVNDEGEEKRLIRIDPVKFDPMFLLWLLYKEWKGEPFESGLTMLNISEVGLLGSERDFFGKSAKVSGSTNIFQSLPFIEGLLKEKLPNQVAGKFRVSGQDLAVDIRESGRVHIKAENDIRMSTKFERVLLGVQLVKELTELRQNWTDLPTEDQYPPPTFAVELYERGKEQEVTIDFEKRLVKRLLRERDESLEDWPELEFS
ncbi:hypothetical protein [Haloprofundus sp. MHR1]|uniref:hypothetical protein n=1 Tax=Haloprofundus sp. MHR1 TaxID=2572921 RepID=UPI0010BE52A2|nr:hypothetical protein [Haloprofundus sp. MHR1]QCJ47222.1 hypothetical protein FCF25_08875 [Haloprofundus sp. MHR1]